MRPAAGTVSEAVATRRSIRAYLDRPVETETLLRVLKKAGRAPSGGNLQPWRVSVVNGPAMTAFRARMEARLKDAPDTPEYAVYPPRLGEPYRSHRFKVGEDMYALLGITREDRPARLRRFAENFRFFGAPAAMFVHVDRQMGPPQWADLGMFLQTVMLLLREEGLDSCAQECWAAQHVTVDAFCGAPPDRMLFCGMAIGYADMSQPVNDLVSDRMPLEEWVKVL